MQKYPAEVAAILARYPADSKRSAVMPLLYLAQRAENYVPAAAIDEVATLCEIAPTQVASIVGFYTLYYDKQGGKHRRVPYT